MNTFTAPTPHTAAAIMAQFVGKHDSQTEVYADWNGAEIEGEAHFSHADTEFDDFGDGTFWGTGCTLEGVYFIDPDTDRVIFAGNRAEAVAVFGLAAIAAWEDSQTEYMA